jgi:putative transcriptional regulator
VSRQPVPPALHPSPDLLLDYATGVADLTGRVVLAAHLGGCAPCREEVEALRAPAGDFLRSLPAAPSHGDAATSSRLWQKLQATIGSEQPASAREEGRASLGLPLPVAAWAELGSRKPLSWQPLRFSPGIRWAPVINDPSTGSMLVAVQGRTKSAFPAHRHVGPELGVILEGGYEDQTGDYRLGDFFAYEPGTSHRPWTDLEEGCTSLIRLESPNRFLGWRRWIFR